MTAAPDSKALKFKRNAKPAPAERIEHLRELFQGNECKVQFALWAKGTHLDVAGLWSPDGDPIFRPAACAWAAWQAAWALREGSA